MDSFGSIAFQLGGKEHCLGPTGSLWYLSETLKIFLDMLASKCMNILKVFKKEQEDCSENAQ